MKFAEQTVLLDSPESRARAKVMVDHAPEDPAVEVVFRRRHVKRSIAQNNLYWQWVGIIAGALFQENAEIHLDLKRLHLIPILRRDPEFERLVKDLHAMSEAGFAAEVSRLKLRLVAEMSTTRLSVPQMSEYLDQVYAWAANQGLVLPTLD